MNPPSPSPPQWSQCDYSMLQSTDIQPFILIVNDKRKQEVMCICYIPSRLSLWLLMYIKCHCKLFSVVAVDVAQPHLSAPTVTFATVTLRPIRNIISAPTS